MIGFYVLAFSVIGALLYIPYAEAVYIGHLNYVTGKIALFCLGGAFVIFWSILPRYHRFIAPGVMLPLHQHPKLSEVLTGIATVSGQRLPSEVYLTNEVNAWVGDRGGLMGIGSRRVMGIGLPLLAILTSSQLRAILAHEFGHYYAGDTKLSPWVYKTRMAFGRTIFELERRGSYLRLPFDLYGKAFLRITHAVSRRQEFAADELAAQLVGARPLIEGLQIIHAHGPAFMNYFMNDVVPVLQNGFRPPLLAGFQRFTMSPLVSKYISEILGQGIASPSASPYDTHPSLSERMRALEEWSNDGTSEVDPPALSLLNNPDQLETQIFSDLIKRTDGKEMQPIAWEEVGAKVWLPVWEARVKSILHQISGYTVEKLPSLCKSPTAASPRSDQTGKELPEEFRRRLGLNNLASALALTLHAAHWDFRASPGENVMFQRKDETVEPFNVVWKLAIGELTQEMWNQMCISAGISDYPLVSPLLK